MFKTNLLRNAAKMQRIIYQEPKADIAVLIRKIPKEIP